VKLTRATIPMCSNCGTKMEPVTGQHYLCCPGCDSTEIPDYGYHAPDVAGAATTPLTLREWWRNSGIFHTAKMTG
jgi:hypothetical protein